MKSKQLEKFATTTKCKRNFSLEEQKGYIQREVLNFMNAFAFANVKSKGNLNSVIRNVVASLERKGVFLDSEWFTPYNSKFKNPETRLHNYIRLHTVYQIGILYNKVRSQSFKTLINCKDSIAAKNYFIDDKDRITFKQIFVKDIANKLGFTSEFKS